MAGHDSPNSNLRVYFQYIFISKVEKFNGLYNRFCASVYGGNLMYRCWGASLRGEKGFEGREKIKSILDKVRVLKILHQPKVNMLLIHWEDPKILETRGEPGGRFFAPPI
jgi:hypothetical protein